MKITSKVLKSWSACGEGYAYFLEHWPNGSSYSEIQAQLRVDKKDEWSIWLTQKAWDAVIKDPSGIAALAQSEVDEALKATKGSPNSSSGDGSTSASSGDHSKSASSGDYSTSASSGSYSTSASSGDHSKSASSGNYSTSASSGNYSTSASSGKNTISMVAGIGAEAKAGENGCIALCWFDGKRNRIVTGYVGEDIEADTWYCVKNGVLVKSADF